MTETKDEILYKRCAGLDVHQDEIAACVRLVSDQGKVTGHAKRFSTKPTGLAALLAWLQEYAITHVVMEGTGVYWFPIYRAIVGHFDITVCNAHHAKRLPGRKTDQSDASWLAQMLSYGSLNKSFIPSDDIRELRELTRTRVHLVEDRARVVNNIHRLLERVGLKLCSVVSDLQGVTARAILGDIASGVVDPVALASHAKGKLRSKRAELQAVLQVQLSPTIRSLLGQQLAALDLHSDHIDSIEEMTRTACMPYAEQMTLLMSAPAIDFISAAAILAEIGADMSVFRGSEGLASWAGVAPGCNESAGKRKRTNTPHGNRYLSRILFQAALTISKMKAPSDLGDFFRKKRAKRGYKRAAVATAHKLLVRIWKLLKDKVSYAQPEKKPLTEQQVTSRMKRSVALLQSLGFHVTLERAAA